MTKTEARRIERLIRLGELNQTWVTLQGQEPFFATKVTLAPHGVVFHTRHRLIDAQVTDIVKAVH